MKLVLESEEMRSKLLGRAKNLRTMKEGGWSKVYLHRDLMAGNEEQNGRRGEAFGIGRGGCCNGKKGFGVGVRELSCMCLNARSIMNKMDEFMVSLEVLRPDVVGITESWASSEVDGAELAVGSYELFRMERSSTVDRRGGGVLLYVRAELSPMEFHPSTEYPERV